MNKALQQAQLAFDKGEVPVGAVVCCHNQIIAQTHNMVEQLNDVTAHAEILAITAAANYLGGKYLNQCTLYVTLEPCIMCGGALYWSQLGMLVYGASDEKRGCNQLKERRVFHPKTLLVSGVMEDSCRDILQRFFKQRRR